MVEWQMATQHLGGRIVVQEAPPASIVRPPVVDCTRRKREPEPEIQNRDGVAVAITVVERRHNNTITYSERRPGAGAATSGCGDPPHPATLGRGRLDRAEASQRLANLREAFDRAKRLFVERNWKQP